MLELAIISTFFILSEVRATINPNLLYNVSCSLATQASAADVAKTLIILYPGEKINDYISRPIENSTSLSQYMNISNPIKMYIHGWQGNCSEPHSQAIINGFIKLGNLNILCIEWGHIAKELYPYAACSIQNVAIAVSNVINYFWEYGFRDLHIIGHSLGAQMCGFIGIYTSCPIGRVTGLDPAAPMFDQGLIPHLTPTAANCVDIHHSNMGVFGTALTIGKTDIYYNGGIFQPGCLNEVLNCSHYRSTVYLAESLGSRTKFIACPCDSDLSCPAGSCNSNSMLIVDLNTSPNASGKYCLNTNSAAPFAKGVNGTSKQEPVSLLGSVVTTIKSLVSFG